MDKENRGGKKGVDGIFQVLEIINRKKGKIFFVGNDRLKKKSFFRWNYVGGEKYGCKRAF